ncbi:glutamyl-tRNA reductase [Streptomyces lunaelactis]|uniref:glutamyl-tRNA reductase n=1 Tax=Streptomyces lunaelactis TaxID=1535768 RepID=UPI00158594FF|nr:glutamyl-tRNA reductase [Streptomyces lunaelactis]NUK05931.1 glutamyl-tRNA reductase [Streptomyces lunaelactis]NUK18405.1 glutamyl-tRNA reductase [Streptomyces lunaelactis]NUK75023.1 glutamyl-tRNA reductase [Streptomyces lunaelactis]NUK76973.1 glutamyl-tRNA reductase [Streptomyces lunaelactis]
MSLLVVGLSHRSAPVSVLERASLASDSQIKLLQDTLAAEPATEAAVLATCNRIELYADVDKFHAGVAELSMLLAQHSGVGLEELTPYLYVHYEDRAVHHLFSVACGLDSMVVGEGQILGQIKDALALGQELHTAGRLINDLFQQALRVGKRAHSETGIDRAGQSLVTFGLQQLADGADVEEWAADKRVLVIGAGSMSSLAATTLARLGVRELVIANRTLERAERLAAVLAEPDGVAAHAVPMASVGEELTRADVAVSCTGATGLVLTAESVAAALAEHVVHEASPSLGETLRAPEGSLVARLAATAARDGRVHDRSAAAGLTDDDAGAGRGSAPDPASQAPAGLETRGSAPDSASQAQAGLDGLDVLAGADGCPVGLEPPPAEDLAQHGAWVDNAGRSVRTGSGARARANGPVRLALLDLAMPRDIDGAVHRLAGVRLVDIESLAEASADAPMAADVDQVRGIVSDEVAAFGAAQRAAHITPTVVALRAMAADVVAGEVARLEGRLPGLDEKQRAEIGQTVRRVVDKLLHAPTVRVKQLAGEPGGAGYADALRTLFDLDPETVASVSRADMNDPNRGRV